MHVRETGIAGLLVFEPSPHRDERGWFSRTFDADVARGAGVDPNAFLQDSQSRTVRAGLRGLHGRVGRGEAKLVRCARGSILDVVVDIRPGSPSFGRWESFELDDESHHQLYVPDGFAHGFCVTSELADVVYKVSTYYDPAAESGFRFDDPEVGIEWPAGIEFEVSARDREAPLLSELGLRG